jgi:chemotaxis protein MotB
MSRRKRPRAHSNHERWLVSYADFITLLFAFFVVLYSSAQVDKRKVGQLALAIQVAFQDLGVFSASTTQIPLDTSEPMPFSTVQAIANVKHNTELGRVSSPTDGELAAASQDGNLSTMQAELEQALKHEIAIKTVALHRDAEGLVISLREFGFFDSGSTALKPSALPALDRIASILSVRNCRLRIEGHTDNVPIHTAQIASNWELSAARSTELVRLLIVRYRFAPNRLSAAAFAEYHPIASNDTAQGRAQNRRVDLVVLTEKIMPSTMAPVFSKPQDSAISKPSAAVP